MLRKHPWIFSGAIQRGDEVNDGDWVEVLDHKGHFLAYGHAGSGSIAVRILSYNAAHSENDIWLPKLSECLAMRKWLFHDFSQTNAYRLVHGEGDGLPGLIIDIYGSCAVIQTHSTGMHRNQQNIALALDRAFGGQLDTIFSKSRAVLHNHSIDDVFLKGQTPETEILENGVRFKVNWVEGQKTGFFLDQRENRKLLGSICQGQTVLNTFCYTGGFSAYALKNGAGEVCSVDVSAKAMELTAINADLNGGSDRHQCITADVNTFLKELNNPFDIVILDPPAFAKSLSKKHQAVMGYKRLNELGMKAVKPGGLLFTFSCSQVIDERLFTGAVTAAGIESGRNARILHRLTQGPDHPVNLFHPEGHYLKGLLLRID